MGRLVGSAAEAAYEKLAANCDRLVVVGLSMGGTLTAWLATRHPEIAGIVVINGFIEPAAPALRKILDMMVAQGVTEVPGIGSDIALPGAVEVAYGRRRSSCTISLIRPAGRAEGRSWARSPSPVLIFTSPEDHVVPPVSSDTLAAGVSGPVERVTLERSYHVATLDYDRELIEQETVAFARRVTRRLRLRAAGAAQRSGRGRRSTPATGPSPTGPAASWPRRPAWRVIPGRAGRGSPSPLQVDGLNW